jgi:hypothetical protein
MLLTVVACLAGANPAARASLNLVGSANYSGPNLVANGSFENGHPGPGMANWQYWASGTTGTPFLSIPGWTGTGQPANYATWGSDETSGPFHMHYSDVIPDGQIAVYFGNGGFLPSQNNTVNLPPTFNPDYTVSFSSTPTFNVYYGGPVILSQTVPTDQTLAPSYGLSFWVSGEGANMNPSDISGIFAVRVSNTLPGDPLIYLQVPSSANSTMGESHVFQFDFTPLNPNLPVTVEFYNYGHLDLSAYGGPLFTTELVLDDVRVVALPEPSAAALLGLGLLAALSARRRSGQRGA